MYISKKILPVALLTLMFLVPSGYVMQAAGSNGGTPVIPVQSRNTEVRGTLVLRAHSEAYVPIVLSSAANLTFQVASSGPLAVYFMNANQFSGFRSSGSCNSIYSSRGSHARGKVGPLYPGTYYLVFQNDLNQSLSVSYSASALQVNIYVYYSSLPAPVGITDYGLLNASGVIEPYRVLYDEAIGTAEIYSMKAYNSSPPSGIPAYGASLQQNVVLQVNTTTGDYVYWLQNVPSFITNTDKMNLNDNIWNFTSYPSDLTNQSITGNGSVYTTGKSHYYAYETPFQPYSLPLSLRLYVYFNYTGSAVYVYFGYLIGSSSSITWYDKVTIHDSGVTEASLVVNGYVYTPINTFYDSELVFGGYGNGEHTNFTQMDANLNMYYLLPNGSLILPPEIYGFGSDTAEAADDLTTLLVNGTPTVKIGSGNFEPVAHSVPLPRYSVNISLQTYPVDAGMKVPVKVTSSVSNGLAPYTYFFYINGKEVYNFTTFSSQFSGTVYLPPLVPGNYSLQTAVRDALGHVNYSSVYGLTVNRDPVAWLSSNVSVTDVGLPFEVSYYAYYGTPPYNYSFYMNGSLVSSGHGVPGSYLGSSFFVPDKPGTWTAKIVVVDSAGYTVSYSYLVTVNPDLTATLSSSVNITDVGLSFNVSAFASYGTPPYSYSFYINGTLEGKGSSTQSGLLFSKLVSASQPGTLTFKLVLVDSRGYSVFRTLKVTVNPDPVPYIGSNVSVTDVGLPVLLSSSARLGTPPYTYSIYINGHKVSSSQSYVFVPYYPGNYSVYVTVKDSAGYSVSSKQISLKVNPDPSLSVSGVSSVLDANMTLNLSARASSGTAPYSFTWFINGSPLCSSANCTFRPRYPGTYTITVVMQDRAGYRLSYRAQVDVHPDPIVTISISRNVYDAGQLVNVSERSSLGTPPYTIAYYVNGTPEASGLIELKFPGGYVIYAKLTDSLGYSVTSNKVFITVNHDPSLTYNYSLSSNSFFYSNDIVTLNLHVKNGTPPYSFAWYLNGQELAVTSYPAYTFYLKDMGLNDISVTVNDSVGYSLHEYLRVDYTYNFLNIMVVIALTAGSLSGVAWFIKSSRKPGKKKPGLQG